MAKKILIIDDEIDSCKLLTDRFTMYGFEAIYATDGETGFAKASNYLPDVIIMDIVMPGFTGLQTTHLLKNNPGTADIPIIFLTGLHADSMILDYLESTKHHVLQKPIDLEKLLGILTTDYGMKFRTVVKWSQSFEFGIDEFDNHHKQLVNLLNDTYDRFNEGARKDDLEALLEELSDYATFHFNAEEHWMEVNEYPGLAKQRAEHDKFSNRVAEIGQDLRKGKDGLTLEVLVSLVNWLKHHILELDAEYGLFAKGLSRVAN